MPKKTTSLTSEAVEYTPVAKIGDMEVGLGATNPMLLAIVIGQLILLIRWLAVWIFDSTKKREQERDELLKSVASDISKLTHAVEILKHTIHTDEDIAKVVRLEFYNQSKGRTQ